jgi:hypothetical protein
VLGAFQNIHASPVAVQVAVGTGYLGTESLRTHFIGSTRMPATATVERIIINIGNRPVAMGDAVAVDTSLPGTTVFPAITAVLRISACLDTCPVTFFHAGGTPADIIGTDLI